MEFKKIRSFGEIINDSVAFVFQNFKSLYKPLFFYVGPIVLLGSFFGAKAQLSDITKEAYGNNTVNSLVNVSCMIIANVMLIALTYGYVYFYIIRKDEKPTMEELWQYNKVHFWKVAGALAFIIMMVALGIFLLVFPGIFMAVTMAFFFAITLFEGADIQIATFRCLQMIKNRWWYTLGVLLVANIVVIIFSLFISVPQFVYSVLLQSGMVKHIESLPLQFTVFLTIGQTIVFFLQVFPQIAIIMHYFSINESLLKEVNERQNKQGE